MPLYLDVAPRRKENSSLNFLQVEWEKQTFECKTGHFQAFCPFPGLCARLVQKATLEEMSEEQKGRNSDIIEI